MGLLFCIIGKSASGKDSLFLRLIHDPDLELEPVITYTTRPMREGEVDGHQYLFVSERKFQKLFKEDSVIEYRNYKVANGDLWRYFTVDDGKINLNRRSSIVIASLEQYGNYIKYYGKNRVIPIYMEVEDGTRLQRAIDREKENNPPNYCELCRRFIADSEDFSPKQLELYGINTICYNDEDLDHSVAYSKAYIQHMLE